MTDVDQTGFLPVDLAAVQLARLFDHPGADYIPPITPERIRQWSVRIRVWAKRHPDRLHPVLGPDRRLRYSLDELFALADTLRPRRLTKDRLGCNVQTQ